MGNREENLDELIEESYGLEYEVELEEDDDDDDEKPFDAEKIRIDNQNLSVEYINTLINNEELTLSPGFQRDKVWKQKKKKSLLIESLMLKIPIPAFYFYETKNSHFVVIDGQQRLTTINEFMSDEFSLRGLEYLTELNGKFFTELPIKYRKNIERTQLTINTLDERSPTRVVFDIFRRINTGGMPLRPQEMRNSITKKHVRELLVRMSTSKAFNLATRSKITNERMDGQEIALRFIMFYDMYNFDKSEIDYDYLRSINDEYRSSKTVYMLDYYIEILNRRENLDAEKYLHAFDNAMNRAYDLFKEDCFSKLLINEVGDIYKTKDIINKALLISTSVILADEKYNETDFTKYSLKAKRLLAEMLNNQSKYDESIKKYENIENDFFNSVTVATGDKKQVVKNFYYIDKMLGVILGD